MLYRVRVYYVGVEGDNYITTLEIDAPDKIAAELMAKDTVERDLNIEGLSVTDSIAEEIK